MTVVQNCCKKLLRSLKSAFSHITSLEFMANDPKSPIAPFVKFWAGLNLDTYFWVIKLVLIGSRISAL